MKDHLLPYGRLRESLKNLHRSNVILITKTPSEVSAGEKKLIWDDMNLLPDQSLFFTSLAYKDPLPVFKDIKPKENISFSDSGIVLITGIANPKPLVEHLSTRAKEIIHLSYPDHYNFSEKDILTMELTFKDLKTTEKFLITTEKDAVRLNEFINIADELKAAFYYIPVSIDFSDNDGETFDNLITEYVRKNKRNHGISQE
jgi:tetraacyldisaccharide 4'-kinase